ncbi:nuclear transport factor 2 family protein [Flavobacterium sp.]|uniref:nuclear transport factor 2 family protein n=1 Tax=Flavobacterium sp. TaxID=239 RepID=UPI00286BCA27|nr:nuclear transport factor 2 family protein [Flavobacterium sp.]
MKNNSIFFLAFLFAGLLTVSCKNNNNTSKISDKGTASVFDSIAMKKIIDEKTNKFTQAHITKDTAYLNHIFTQDAKAYPPNSDAVIGRAAIAVVNSEWVNYEIKEFREESTSFFGNEDYLIDEGKYYLRYGENNIVDKGKYINIWKKENGDWKIYSNIWNTSLPAVATK